VFVTLRSLGKFENVISSNDNSNVEVCVRNENKPGKLGEVASFIGSMGSNITSVDIEEDGDEYLIVSFILKLPKHTTKTDMIVQLQSLNGVSVL
jgi:putative Mg2+ transporter-C (MgtC) family protein